MHVKSLEDREQMELIRRVNTFFKCIYPELLITIVDSKGRARLVAPFHSNPNGVNKSRFQSALMRSTGQVSGVPDLTLPIKNKDYSGLYIELKTNKSKKSGYSYKNQKTWMEFLQKQGFKAVFCVGANEAFETVKEYMRNR